MNKPNIATPKLSKTPAVVPDPARREPSLRAAMLVYLLVVIGTIAIIVSLSEFIDITFLRLATAVFIVAGGLIGVAILTGAPIEASIGRRPGIQYLITAFLVGLAVWLPATWLLIFVSQFLGGAFGNLTASLNAPRAATFETQFVILAVIIPVCQGLLFFGYIFRAARAIGAWRAVWLLALMYGLYGFFSAGRGFAAAPSYFVVGLAAAALTLRSGSPFAGALVISGFFLGEPILSDAVVRPLGATQDILSLQWLTAVVVSGFIAFVLVQLSRIFGTPPAIERRRPARLWWVPLLAVLLISAGILLGEVNTRNRNRLKTLVIPPASGSTAPPILPTATRSQPPKTPNQ